MKRLISVTAALCLLCACSLNEAQGEKNPAKKENPPKEVKEEKEDAAQDDLVLEAAYFNEINEVDGKKVILNPVNILSLMNKEFYLPADYAPNDLVRPNVAFSFGDEDVEKSYLRREAAEALENMFAAAKEEGVILYAVSGYRSYDRQKAVLAAEINRVGKEKAEQAVAIPGTSEHQSGLAMDISSESEGYLLTENFGLQAEGIWLRENAHRFGFILRYPKEKEDITQYQYEPWHFRYVGEDAAKIIYEKDWTLEEFFSHVKKI